MNGHGTTSRYAEETLKEHSMLSLLGLPPDLPAGRAHWRGHFDAIVPEVRLSVDADGRPTAFHSEAAAAQRDVPATKELS